MTNAEYKTPANILENQHQYRRRVARRTAQMREVYLEVCRIGRDCLGGAEVQTHADVLGLLAAMEARLREK